MKRFLTVILSAILFTAIGSLSSYISSSQQELNVYYFDFLETFTFAIIFVGPVYILVGLPLSLFIDKLSRQFNTKSKLARYAVQLVLYSLAGILVGVIYFIIFNPINDVLTFSVIGFTASNVYLHLSLLLSVLANKKYKQLSIK
ncbi:MAG: hypothetical protein ACQEWU_16195 [Bacillota bacterium]|uniref:hypothetical protein n=1 Tax=Virgibacillus salarius TaxID=447199 RepID=UPI0031E3D467